VRYLPRLADQTLAENLDALGAVLIEGIRGCGKTETARQRARSEVRLDVDKDAAQLAALDPALLLDGETPRLIDEWQLEPKIWNLVRRAVDDRRSSGQFILTGSSTPDDTVRRHPGAGRFAVMRMRTMTLQEKQATTPSVSFRALLAGEPVTPALSELSLVDYFHHIVMGGWPELVGATEATARRFLEGYLATTIERDLPEASRTRRNPALVRRFLHAYAQQTAQPTTLKRIAAYAAGLPDNADPGALNWKTAAAYRDTLTRMRILDDLPGWEPPARATRRFTSTPKRHLADPALAAHLLGLDSAGLRKDLSTAGLLFESLAVHDLRACADACDAWALHYRTQNSREEIDCVIETTTGDWIGFEAKLGTQAAIDQAIRKLKHVEGNLRRPAKNLVVITAGGLVESRNGVQIVPLGALGA
jgi:predicted AAA+ superfamily ATPase